MKDICYNRHIRILDMRAISCLICRIIYYYVILCNTPTSLYISCLRIGLSVFLIRSNFTQAHDSFIRTTGNEVDIFVK